LQLKSHANQVALYTRFQVLGVRLLGCNNLNRVGCVVCRRSATGLN